MPAVAVMCTNAPSKAHDTTRHKRSVSATEIRHISVYLSSTVALSFIKMLSPVQIQTAVGRLFISLMYGVFRHLSLRHLFCFICHVLAPTNTVAMRCRVWLREGTAFGGVQRKSVVSGTCSWLVITFSYSKINQMLYFIKFIFGIKLYMFRTVPLSIIRSFSLYTQQWYMSYRFADSL